VIPVQLIGPELVGVRVGVEVGVEAPVGVAVGVRVGVGDGPGVGVASGRTIDTATSLLFCKFSSSSLETTPTTFLIVVSAVGLPVTCSTLSAPGASEASRQMTVRAPSKRQVQFVPWDPTNGTGRMSVTVTFVTFVAPLFLTVIVYVMSWLTRGVPDTVWVTDRSLAAPPAMRAKITKAARVAKLQPSSRR